MYNRPANAHGEVTLMAKLNAYVKASTMNDESSCIAKPRSRHKKTQVTKPADDHYAIAHGIAMLATELANKVQSNKLPCQ